MCLMKMMLLMIDVLTHIVIEPEFGRSCDAYCKENTLRKIQNTLAPKMSRQTKYMLELKHIFYFRILSDLIRAKAIITF